MEELFGIPMDNIMLTLLALFGVSGLGVISIYVTNPVMFRMGVRNLRRRGLQSVLVVVGLMLATLITTAAFTTGDTVDHSISRAGYQQLQRSDLQLNFVGDTSMTNDIAVYFADSATEALDQRFTDGKLIDGFLPLLQEPVAVVNGRTGLSEPSIILSGVDARRLDDLGGLRLVDGGTADVSALQPDEILLSKRAAESLDAVAGDVLTVSVNGTTLHSDHIFINTGARPRVPAIPGLENTPYLTNRNIMDLTDFPEHLLVLGGSYIGLEFGQMFRRFGSRVTVIETGDQLIGREDEDVARSLQEALEQEGIRFRLRAETVRVAGHEGEIVLTLRQADGSIEQLTGSHLLVAVGRAPNTGKLNLAAAGVATTASGHIPVNDRLVTNVPGIWALGDVKGGPAFTHVSYDDHLIVYDNLFGGGTLTTRNRIVPYALFTDPELGRVGLTEREARAAGYRLKIGKIPMAWVARAIERNETAGLMKIVIDAATDRILGAAVLGSEGGELVQTLMALMMADAAWTLFYRAIFIHPSMTEGFFTLMDNVKADEPEPASSPDEALVFA